MIMSQPKNSVYLFSEMVDDAVPTNIYAVYDNIQEAIYELSDIYTNGLLGVRFDNEFVIIKHEVRSSRPRVDKQ
tara:strand:- start:802 stop:1023 length:222 start_codon:yes stop_codon:yes gene_type:complete